MILKALLAATSGSGISGPGSEYVDDVFSADPYNASTAGTTNTITNGIDYTQGGMTLFKIRTTTGNWQVLDSTRRDSSSFTSSLSANTTAIPIAPGGNSIAINAGAFTLSSGDGLKNNPGAQYISYSFRKAQKFFDLTTYTSTGTAQNLPHELNCEIGMVWIKRTDAVGNWCVWHRGSGNADAYTGLSLNLTATAELGPSSLYSNMTSSVFRTSQVTGGGSTLASSAGSYVAYLFAHDPSPTGKIFCGTFTSNASGVLSVTLPWEPQFILFKAVDGNVKWSLFDAGRGMTYGSTAIPYLDFSTSVENVSNTFTISPHAAGFNGTGFTTNNTYIFMAIRRENKPVTDPALAFMPQLRTGTGSTTLVNSNSDPVKSFSPDLILTRPTASTTGFRMYDRTRGPLTALTLATTVAAANVTSSVTGFDFYNGFEVGTGAPNTGVSYINYLFKRAPGLFDIARWTGTGLDQNRVNHGLRSQPSFVIIKRITATGAWRATIGGYQSSNSLGQGVINSNAAFAAPTVNGFNFTDTYIELSTGADINASGGQYIAYLFGEVPGVSKGGTYVGNSSSTQTINCGFTNGARFVLVKPMSAVGDWVVVDTSTGIVSGGTESTYGLNIATVPTALDLVDPSPTGFIAKDTLNTVGVTYGYFAIA